MNAPLNIKKDIIWSIRDQIRTAETELEEWQYKEDEARQHCLELETKLEKLRKRLEKQTGKRQ